jgi:hypothetical protein
MVLSIVVPLVDAILGVFGGGSVYDGGFLGGIAVKSLSEGRRYFVSLRLVPE